MKFWEYSVVLLFQFLMVFGEAYAQSSSSPAGRHFIDDSAEVAKILKELEDREKKAQKYNKKKIEKEAFSRGDGIAMLIDDLQHENTAIKSSAETDKYHACLLSETKGESEQKKNYDEKFRAYISYANRSFGVPATLLTCTCGRESRFDSDAKHSGGAVGVCQATGSFITEINKFIAKSPRIRAEWQSYLDSISNRIESPDCLKGPLSKSLMLKCPSLGIGAAALYMQHIFARIDGGREKLSEEAWAKTSLDVYTVVAGTYNLGVTFADNTLKDVQRRQDWAKTLLNQTCSNWLVSSSDPRVRKAQVQRAEAKFSELKNHMVSIRNCLQKNNYLNHQNKAMGGACLDPKRAESNLASVEKYKRSLPHRCEGGQVIRTAESDTPGGRD